MYFEGGAGILAKLGRKGHMELKVLRNFITVVEEGGVTAAADVLRVSQPALSRQIGGLESAGWLTRRSMAAALTPPSSTTAMKLLSTFSSICPSDPAAHLAPARTLRPPLTKLYVLYAYKTIP